MAAGRYPSAQHIRQGVPARISRLAHQQNRPDPGAGAEKFCIDHATHIQNNHDLSVVSAQQF